MEEINLDQEINEQTDIKNKTVSSAKNQLKIMNDDSMSDDRKSDEETEATEFDVHENGLIMTLQNLIKLQRKIRKSKKITVDLSNTKYDVIKEICGESFTWNITNRPSGDWNIRWQDFYINEDDLRRMLPYQKINHFPGSYNLGKKNYLGKNLSKMRIKFPDDYDFCPRTWLLPYQYEDLRAFYEKNKTKKPVFIVKPEASCQGKGIYLVKKFSTLKQDQHMVVQEYIKHPLLIDGLKFDFRVYVLVKSVCPLKVFIYREGLARFATCKYQKPSKKNLKNMCMHLTNYAVNKHNPQFQFNSDAGQDDIGHKRSFSSILKYLEDNGKDANGVFMQIRQIVNKTMCSVQPYLSHLYRSCQLKEENNEMCFEVFGFDVMLDENLKAYLIEVNHTPSFTADTPLDYHIKHSLITDTLILVDTRNKAKSNYLESKKQMIVGKSNIKMSQDDKESQQRKTEAYEYKNQNGYCKSLPTRDDPLNYEKYIQAAQSIHDEFTGTKRNSERLTTQQQPSSTSLNQVQTNSKKNSDDQIIIAPKSRNTKVIRRPVSGIPISISMKRGAENNKFENKDNYKILNNGQELLNQSLNQSLQKEPKDIIDQDSQQKESAKGYQSQILQNQGNTSSSSSLQTASAATQKGNTNHIIKNIRRISSRGTGYKPSQSIVDYSMDGNTQTGSSTNINVNGQKYNNGISSVNNNSREEKSFIIYDKSDQLKQMGGIGSSNNMQYHQRPESGRQDLSYKLDQLKRELQIAKDEATKCMSEQEYLRVQQMQQNREYQYIDSNSKQPKYGFHANQRPQSSSIVGQTYRNNINAGVAPLPPTQSRQLIQAGNKQLIVKIKDDQGNNSANQATRNLKMINNNGVIVHVSSVHHSNNLQQNRNEFLSIQKAKIETKLYQNGMSSAQSNNNQLIPLNQISNRGIQNINGYQNSQNYSGNGNNNNHYLNNISPKHYQNQITPSSQQFIQQNNNSLNILSEMGNKNFNVLVENKEKQNYKSRGNSAIGISRDIKNGQQGNNNNQYNNQQIPLYQHNNNLISQKQQQNSRSGIRSNSYSNLHNEKGYVLTVENAQTTTNATNYAQRKGLPMRQFKFDDKISSLKKFNIEEEIQK